MSDRPKHRPAGRARPAPRIPALLALIAALFILPGTAPAQEVTLRVHHFLPASSTTHADFLEPWAERVVAQSGGRIAVEIYPAMQLGGAPPGLYDQVRDGVVDVAWTLPGYTPGRFPISEVFELPFMAASAEATSQAVQEFYQRHLGEEFGDVHVLMLHVHAPGSFHLRDAPVTRLEDLAGRQVRAPSRTINAALAELGAIPVGMPVPEVPEALARGVIDGAVIPFEVARPLRVPELVDYHTRVVGPNGRGFYTALFLFAMNKDVYDGLSPDLQAVIDANAGLPLAQEIGAVWDAAEEPGIAAALAEGNTIHVVEGEEAERWRAATRPVIDRWVAEMDAQGLEGEALLEEARSLVDRYAGAP
ncbi:MAG: C4-dicarboxylate ABC transporter [Alphaproteobacteria bacterium]|jgi:TRAP-type C4-dicarboxylate transport system substrate-binding protein|nr:C4-dicarboxylate ABC transporter [Alphaproteobacteria bacterium]